MKLFMVAQQLRSTFEEFIDEIEDPRIDRRKLHSLEEILFVIVVGLICDCDGWTEMEYFAKAHPEVFRTFYSYKNGFPSDDTLRRVMRRLGNKQFRNMFHKWVSTIPLSKEAVIAIDGKVSRNSTNESGKQLTMVSACETDQGIVLAQEKTTEKSNEITAIPKVLDALDLAKGKIVTIDAIGCQKSICRQIQKTEADYVIAIKDNQPKLFQEVQTAFEQDKSQKSICTIQEDGHGRFEARSIYSIALTKELREFSWPGLKSIVKIESVRCVNGETTRHERYYLSSLVRGAERHARIIRSHWAIENKVHWLLDTVFLDDESRINQGNAPENLAVLKHFVLNLLKFNKEKRVSYKRMRKLASWKSEQLMKILASIKEFK